MILHYANLCVVAGGVDLFVIGSELRGLETIRGSGLDEGRDDRRLGLRDLGLSVRRGPARRSPTTCDRSSTARAIRRISRRSRTSSPIRPTGRAGWAGSTPAQNGQWPHLDQLWADAEHRSRRFDNYLPLTDWTTGGGGLDVDEWSEPKPSGAWPPSPSTMSGLGLIGRPVDLLDRLPQGEHRGRPVFQLVLQRRQQPWPRPRPERLGAIRFAAGGRPAGADAQPVFPEAGNPRATKQLRWWWNNVTTRSTTRARAGLRRVHKPNGRRESKSIVMLEYGVSAVDKATNQPNVFFDSEVERELHAVLVDLGSGAMRRGYLPRRDDTIAALALAGDLRILERRRQQRDRRAAASHASMDVLLRLELGRAAVPDLPDPEYDLGRHRQLAAGDWCERACRIRCRRWRRHRRRRLRPSQTFPTLSDARLVGSRQAEVLDLIAEHVSGRSSRAASYAHRLFRRRTDL